MVTLEDILISLDDFVLVSVKGVSETKDVIGVPEKKVIGTNETVIRALNSVGGASELID